MTSANVPSALFELPFPVVVVPPTVAVARQFATGPPAGSLLRDIVITAG